MLGRISTFSQFTLVQFDPKPWGEGGLGQLDAEIRKPEGSTQ